MMYISPYELERLIEERIAKTQLEVTRSKERALIHNYRLKTALSLEDIFTRMFGVRRFGEQKVSGEYAVNIEQGLTITSQECATC